MSANFACLPMVCILAVSFLPGAALCGVRPPGPPIGANRYRASIDGTATEPDVDDYVALLARGETLCVRVSGHGIDGLAPAISLVGPNGLAREVDVRLRRRGRGARVRSFAVDATGPWTVRVGGRDGSRGSYKIRFRVGRAPRARFVGVGLSSTHALHAVAGSRLDLRLRSRGGEAALGGLHDPVGEPLAGLAAVTSRKGRRVVVRGLPLAAETGVFAAIVTACSPSTRHTLLARVRPPDRPRGLTRLGPEPRLDPVGRAIEAAPGELVTLRGAAFDRADRVRCRFGAVDASVAEVSRGGTRLTVVVPEPENPSGGPVPITVVNADGQFAAREDAFAYRLPRVIDVAALAPTPLRVPVGGFGRLRAILTEPAPPGGVELVLATEGGVGLVPPRIVVHAGATLGGFDLAAAGRLATGRVSATLAGTAWAAVDVFEPDAEPEPEPQGEPMPEPGPADLDLSGWQLVQTGATRTYVIPLGTVIGPGGYLVVGRGRDRADFEAFWGVALGDGVIYLNAGSAFPVINGDETFELRDAEGGPVDGPSIPIPSGAGTGLQRVSSAPAGNPEAWSTTTSVYETADPGSGQKRGRVAAGIYLSEVSDAPGSGNYPFEFVELFFDVPGGEE